MVVKKYRGEKRLREQSQGYLHPPQRISSFVKSSLKGLKKRESSRFRGSASPLPPLPIPDANFFIETNAVGGKAGDIQIEGAVMNRTKSYGGWERSAAHQRKRPGWRGDYRWRPPGVGRMESHGHTI